MKKVNGFSMSMKKNSSELIVMGIFQGNQLKDKYITNEKKCNENKDIVTFLSNNSKVRGNYEHYFGFKYKKLI